MRCVMLSVLATAVLAGRKTPEQIHIALHGQNSNGNSNGMNIAWYTEEDTGDHTVNYGLDANSLDKVATGTSHKYYEGYHHTVNLENLAPATRYYYRAGSSDEMSGTFYFKTAPDSNTADGFSMSVFGDMGWLGSHERPMLLRIDGLKKNWSAVPTRVQMEKMYNNGQIDMVWHLGDIAYADDAFAHDVVGDNYESCYNGYMNWFQNISAHVPYHVSVGNHESECHSPICVTDIFMGRKLSNFSAYNTRWHMPSASSHGVQNMWYSWNYGPIHFVSLNSETDFPGAPEEHKGDSGIYPAGGFGREGEYMAWLEADLKAADDARKSGAPNARNFIVVGGHRPCCNDVHGVQELFDTYQVDLYVSGHEHTYARSTGGCRPPACVNTVNNSKTHTKYAFCGGTGSEETNIISSGPSPTPGNPSFATPELSSCLLKVVNSSVLQWELVSSIDGRVIDQFDLPVWNARCTDSECH